LWVIQSLFIALTELSCGILRNDLVQSVHFVYPARMFSRALPRSKKRGQFAIWEENN